MNISTLSIKKISFFLSILGLSIFISSCGTYKEQVVDGIYDDGTKVVVTEIVEADDMASNDNYFKRELDKYENFDNDEEIILNPDAYSSENKTDDEYENASWGDEVDDTNITYHSNIWYHPYHSYGYYGYAYNNFPRYRYYRQYRPHYYGYNSFYMSPYDSWYGYGYGGYYNSYYGSSYYNNYGYYNNNYYGGYGYGGYDGYAVYIPSDRYYGRRSRSNDGLGRRASRRGLSQSILSSDTSSRSIISGNVDFINPSTRKPTYQTGRSTSAKPVMTTTTSRERKTTTRKNTSTQQTRNTNTTTKQRRYTPRSSKRNSSSTRSRSNTRRFSGTSSGSSRAKSSSSSSSGKSKSSSSSSSGRRR